MASPLPEIETLDADVAAHLRRLGQVFVTIERHDSGNTSWGVEIDGRRWFVKAAGDSDGVGWLRSAERFHAAVKHPAIVPLHRVIPIEGGMLAVLYPWVDGEVLNDPFVPNAKPRDDATSAYQRFRGLSPAELGRALDTIYDAHLAVAAAGFVAVDFYDGCVIYDFATAAVRLVDLDMYRPGPYVLDRDRQYGSTRFMAPEEFRRGARIDERSTVYTLGRTAFVLLSEDPLGATGSDLWRATAAQYSVAARAVQDDADARYETVAAFVAAWQAATAYA